MWLLSATWRWCSTSLTRGPAGRQAASLPVSPGTPRGHEGLRNRGLRDVVTKHRRCISASEREFSLQLNAAYSLLRHTTAIEIATRVQNIIDAIATEAPAAEASDPMQEALDPWAAVAAARGIASPAVEAYVAQPGIAQLRGVHSTGFPSVAAEQARAMPIRSASPATSQDCRADVRAVQSQVDRPLVDGGAVTAVARAGHSQLLLCLAFLLVEWDSGCSHRSLRDSRCLVGRILAMDMPSRTATWRFRKERTGNGERRRKERGIQQRMGPGGPGVGTAEWLAQLHGVRDPSTR